MHDCFAGTVEDMAQGQQQKGGRWRNFSEQPALLWRLSICSPSNF